MKTIALWLSGLTALFLFSCTKDVNETTALSDYSASSRFNPSNTQPSAGVTAEFSKDPATPGETVQLVINTTASCGKLMVERAVNGNGDFTSAENAVDWIDYSMNIDATGSAINVPYTTTDIGIWGFRVHYISSGQGCNYANEFIELNLTVEAACAGLSLSRELVSAIDQSSCRQRRLATWRRMAPGSRALRAGST